MEMRFIMLAEAQKTEIGEILQQELGELEQSAVELRKLLQPVSPDNAIGRISRMDALEMQSVNNSKLGNQQRRIEQIRLALSRLKNDEEFGVCQECGNAILIERLRLRPESQYCVNCQQILDDQ